MTGNNVEQIRPAPQADGIWRPAWLEARQAYVCERYKHGQGDDGKPVLQRETWGARMNGKFSPCFIFGECSARATCDRLNAEEPANGR